MNELKYHSKAHGQSNLYHVTDDSISWTSKCDFHTAATVEASLDKLNLDFKPYKAGNHHVGYVYSVIVLATIILAGYTAFTYNLNFQVTVFGAAALLFIPILTRKKTTYVDIENVDVANSISIQSYKDHDPEFEAFIEELKTRIAMAQESTANKATHTTSANARHFENET